MPKTITQMQYRPLASLSKYPGNPRTIKDDSFKKLVQSIDENPDYFEARPIILSDRTGKLVIIAGNQRYEAAKQIGIKDVPTVLIPALTEEKEKELIIRDNISNGDWDMDMLADDWDSSDLQEWGLDVPDWGSDESDNGLTDADAVPEVEEEAITQLGDIWLLGDHRVMCGDSTDLPTVERLMNGQKANMVFTDPPYGVDYDGGIQFSKDGVKKGQREKLKNDDSAKIYYSSVDICNEIVDGPVYMWFADSKANELYDAIAKSNAQIHALIIWVKNGGYGALNACYKQKHEPCLFWKPRNKKLHWNGPTTENTIWNIDKDGVNKLHPTQKPVALAERAINNHDSGSILDLFLGSGSTLIACEKTERKCYGMELAPNYVDVIVKRWQDFTGQEAIHESTGETFNSRLK